MLSWLRRLLGGLQNVPLAPTELRVTFLNARLRLFPFVFLLCLVLAWGCYGGRRADKVVVGSKNFTEQSVLGELLAQQIERTTKLRVERKLYLGGTLVCHEALTAGKIDTYVEYTGTAFTVVLKNEPINDPGEVYRRTREAYLSRFGVELAEPLGFNNTFAII